MKLLEKISELLNKLLTFLGGVFLVGMIVLTCANILSRLIWVPIIGTFEMMGFFGAIVTAFALGYTQIKRGHIAVDVLVNTFSDKVKKTLSIVNNAICCLFFLVAAWQISIKANTLMHTGEVTETLQVIYYPFTYAVAFGCLVLSVTLMTEIIRAFLPEDRGEN
ncbi:MAG: TRAP transporter small permease [Deltaproteobacteria bacterium]|nr:TRAP transporter small permease [Deltaproteobacteria bacterium]